MNKAPASNSEIDYPTARAKVSAFIATVRQPGKHPWEITRGDEAEQDGFWLFSWAAKSDLWPKRKYTPTAGNCPLAVRKRDGAMFMWNVLCSWEEFVERVESGNLHPYGHRIE